MKKSVLDQVERGTAEWVVGHAMWQKSQGRKPSEPYGNIRNPQHAYRAALLDLFYSTPSAGSYVDHYIAWMVKVATLIRMPMCSVFNGVNITVWPGDIPDDLARAYRNECERRHKEYLNSPEYKLALRKAKEAQRARNAQLREFLAVAPKKMTCIDVRLWRDLYKKNTDPYGRAILSYASRWARIMEGQINIGRALEDCASEASHVGDNEGITGFMYGMAVSILSRVWVHGDQLRRWHNRSTQIGDEGDRANEEGGVLNPAVLIIGAS